MQNYHERDYKKQGCNDSHGIPVSLTQELSIHFSGGVGRSGPGADGPPTLQLPPGFYHAIE